MTGVISVVTPANFRIAAGIPLEQIDLLFTDRTTHDEDEKPAFYRKLQWSIVGKASGEVKRQRRLRKGGSDSRVEADAEKVSSEKSKSSLDHANKS